MCPFISLNKKIDNDNNAFPIDFQTSDEELAKALKQTRAARNLFYSIEFNKRLSNHFSLLAEAFNDFIIASKKIKEKNKNYQTILDILIKKEIQRQVPNKDPSTEFKILTPSFIDLLNILKNETEEKKKKILIENVISSIEINKKKDKLDIKHYANSNYYFGFVGLLGDIGAYFNDMINRDKKLDSDDLLAFEIFGKEESIKKSQDLNALLSPDSFYSSEEEGRNKGKERGLCFVDELQKEKVIAQRSGILNKGTEVDEELKIESKSRLPSLAWPFQTVPKKLIQSCKPDTKEKADEPWSGHFSASQFDIIFMQEILLKGKNVKIEKDIIAGISSAFLIATGMHSAAEIYWINYNYFTNSKLSFNDYMKKYCNLSTRRLTKLMNNITRRDIEK